MEKSRKSRGQRHKNRRRGPDATGRCCLYGIHAVEAALANPQRQNTQLFATRNGLARLDPSIDGRDTVVDLKTSGELTRLAGPDAVHQGAVLLTDPLPDRALGDILDGMRSEPSHQPFLVLLDQVTDPHNVGAILRSAAAFGVDALIMTHRNSPPLSGALAKAACGGLEHVPVVLVTNLARALDALREVEVWCIGLHGGAGDRLEDVRPVGPRAIALGAEGRGLRRLTREHCDQLCRITTLGPLASLNVSNAAAIALHYMSVGEKPRQSPPDCL